MPQRPAAGRGKENRQRTNWRCAPPWAFEERSAAGPQGFPAGLSGFLSMAEIGLHGATRWAVAGTIPAAAIDRPADDPGRSRSFRWDNSVSGYWSC